MKILVKTIILVILLALLPIAAQAKIVQVATSGSTIMVLDSNGTVWAWGDNEYGAVGIGTMSSPGDYILAPQKVPIDNVTAIACGAASLALKSDGTVWAWGYGGSGMLGDGNFTDQDIPVQVNNLTNIVAITASSDTAYALKSDGTVWEWGEIGIYHSQAPEYTPNNLIATPMQVEGLTGVVALGEHGSYAIKDDGTVWAWGDNIMNLNPNTCNITTGWLGVSGPELLKPTQLNITNIKQITSDNYGTFYLKNDGTVWAWGLVGQLGDGNVQIEPTNPTLQPGEAPNNSTYLNELSNNFLKWIPHVSMPSVQTEITDVKQISAEGWNCIALKNDSTVWTWGQTPSQVNGLSNIVQVIGGSDNDFVIESDGSVWGWGGDDGGVLEAPTGAAEREIANPVLLFKPSDDGTTTTPTQAPTITPTPTTTLLTVTPLAVQNQTTNLTPYETINTPASSVTPMTATPTIVQPTIENTSNLTTKSGALNPSPSGLSDIIQKVWSFTLDVIKKL